MNRKGYYLCTWNLSNSMGFPHFIDLHLQQKRGILGRSDVIAFLQSHSTWEIHWFSGIIFILTGRFCVLYLPKKEVLTYVVWCVYVISEQFAVNLTWPKFSLFWICRGMAGMFLHPSRKILEYLTLIIKCNLTLM